LTNKFPDESQVDRFAVVVVDLHRYTQCAHMLQESLGAKATASLNDQIRGLIDTALKDAKIALPPQNNGAAPFIQSRGDDVMRLKACHLYTSRF